MEDVNDAGDGSEEAVSRGAEVEALDRVPHLEWGCCRELKVSLFLVGFFLSLMVLPRAV